MHARLIAATLAAMLSAPIAHAADAGDAADAGGSAAGASGTAAIEHGRQLFIANTCYSCHGTAGQGAERTGPRLAPNPFPLVAFVMQLRQPRGVMPRYPKQFLSDADVADIHAYLSSVPASPPAESISLLDNFKPQP